MKRLRHNSIHFSLPVSCEHFRNLVIVVNATRTVIVVIISALSFRSRRAYHYNGNCKNFWFQSQVYKIAIHNYDIHSY